MSISAIVFIIYILISEYITIKITLETEPTSTFKDITFLLIMIILAPVVILFCAMYIILTPIFNRTTWKEKLMEEKEEIVSETLPKVLKKYKNYFKD